MRLAKSGAALPLLAITCVLAMTACSQQEADGPTPSADDTSSAAVSAPESESPEEEPSEEECAPGEQDAATESQGTENLVKWEDNAEVSHLFFHSLVVDTDRAFHGSAEAAGYLDYMVTIDEFNAIIEQLYERDYILISPQDLYDADENGNIEEETLELPEGKTPVVLSFDDLSYYEYMEGDGFADRLIIEDCKVVNEYIDAEDETHIGAYDYVTLLDDFVEEHPDFSHEGAKGVVGLTGYNGILGYRTSDSQYGDSNDKITEDKETAQEVADVMKENGWEFASHSWGHIDYAQSSVSWIIGDHERWKDEVEPLVGETDMLIFPFGADIAGMETYSNANEKFSYLKDQGFNAYFPIDASVSAWGQLNSDSLRQSRINVDGISLRSALLGENNTLETFFDPESVVDEARPESISGTD